MPYYFKKSVSGFTIVELLVSIGIITVILSILLSRQTTLTEASALTNLADNISATIAQAQVYGVGVKEFSTGSNEFSASYGLTFSLLGGSGGSSTAYLYFADRNGNQIYDNNWSCTVGGSSECLQKITMDRGNYISSMCMVRSGKSDLCSVSRVDITFARPSTEAQLIFFNNGGNQMNDSKMIGAKIKLQSPSGLTRYVVAYKTGQVSVQ